jgi:hypothetical protein
MAHEAGHLFNHQDINKMLGEKTGRRLNNVLRSSLFHGGSALASVLAGGLLPRDSFVGRNAWVLPLLTSAPMVGEEAVASLRGLNFVRKKRGIGAAIREAIPLAGALGTYAAIGVAPAVAAYLANRLKAVRK